MTELRAFCPGCSKRLKTAEGVAVGQRLRCPRCSLSFVVRDEDIRPANGQPVEAARDVTAIGSSNNVSLMEPPAVEPALPELPEVEPTSIPAPPSARVAPPLAPPPPPVRRVTAAGKGGALLLTALGLVLLLGGGFVAILIANSRSNDDDDRKDDPSRVIAQGDKKDGQEKDRKKPDEPQPGKPAPPPKDIKKPDAPPQRDGRKPASPPNEPTTPPLATAQLTQLSAETQKHVDAAVEKGVQFLRKMQSKDGHWNNARHGLLASAALPAMTLLECGVPANDPAIQKAAAYVRLHGPKEQATYHLSLAILFLDRLADPQDRRLIQKMALRLMAGQRSSGGWVYHCPNELSDREEYAFFQALEHTRPTSPLQLFDRDRDDRTMDFFIVPPQAMDANVGPGAGTSQVREKPGDSATTGSTGPANTQAPRNPDKPPAAPVISDRDYASMPLDLLPRQRLDLKDVPNRLKNLPVVRPLPAAKELTGGDGTDNSNTQFGILGIWAAGRHGVPTERALALLAKRFRRSQANDGSWGYHFRTDGHPENRAAMTCAGLLGLAVGHGVVVSTGGQPKGIEQDMGLKKGLVALSKHVEGLPSIDRIRGKARPKFVGNVDYYYLWSLERVGVLFNLHEINGKEWYPWGVDIIVERQNKDGSWTGPLSDAHADTCFALLFLKRTNLVRDLSRQFENIAEKETKKN